MESLTSVSSSFFKHKNKTPKNQYVHRCGRAGRSKVSGHVGDNKKEDTSNATVYSFFHRELAQMANDVVDLLRSCKAWVDPNLIALVPGGAKQGDGESKRKKRKSNKIKDGEPDAVEKSTSNPKKTKTSTNPKKTKTSTNPKKTKNSIVDDNMGLDSDDEIPDEFPDLAPNRIVLKRASHVPLSDSDSDETS